MKADEDEEPAMGADTPRVNAEIDEAEVRLVDRDGEQLGVLGFEAARELAASRQLELVEVEADARPPVCRLMSDEEIDRRYTSSGDDTPQSPMVLREVRLDAGAGLTEAAVTTTRAHLDNGDAVKFTIRGVGRGDGATNSARAVCDALAESVDAIGDVDSPPSRAGRDMSMFLCPS